MREDEAELVRLLLLKTNESEKENKADIYRLYLALRDILPPEITITCTLGQDHELKKDFMEYFQNACKNENFSINYMQQCLNIGFNRASHYISVMEGLGILTPRTQNSSRILRMDYDEAIQMLDGYFDEIN